MEENKKPLSEWTLGEVKAFCVNHARSCDDRCPMYDAVGCFAGYVPSDWDLEEKPRWSSQDVEHAKALALLFEMEWVSREANDDLWLYTDEPSWVENRFVTVGQGLRVHRTELIPSLRPGEKVRLADIISAGADAGGFDV